jgi:hypothetical protein
MLEKESELLESIRAYIVTSHWSLDSLQLPSLSPSLGRTQSAPLIEAETVSIPEPLSFSQRLQTLRTIKPSPLIQPSQLTQPSPLIQPNHSESGRALSRLHLTQSTPNLNLKEEQERDEYRWNRRPVKFRQTHARSEEILKDIYRDISGEDDLSIELNHLLEQNIVSITEDHPIFQMHYQNHSVHDEIEGQPMEHNFSMANVKSLMEARAQYRSHNQHSVDEYAQFQSTLETPDKECCQELSTRFNKSDFSQVLVVRRTFYPALANILNGCLVRSIQ